MNDLSQYKIIFLDIDGVLNIYSGKYNTYLKYGVHFEKELILNFNKFFRKTY